MKIAFNPSNSSKNILDLIKTNKDIIFDLKGHSIYARGVEFKGIDTNTWRDIKINNVSIGSNILDLRNGTNTTLTNTNGVVTINSTWRPVVDNLTSDSTTSSLSANQGRVLKALIDSKSDSGHNHDDRYYTKAESDIKYITDITTSINKLTFTKNGSNITRDITVNNVQSLGRRSPLTERNAISGIYTYGTYSATDNLAPSSYFETLGFGEGTNGTIEIGGSWISNGQLYWRALRDVSDNWFSWKTILDSSNYFSILDTRYYTETEVNNLLSKKLDRVNLTTGSWNPRSYNLAADYHYNGGDLSISENGGKMYVSIDGQFYQNEGQYRVLDTSDISSIRGSLTLDQYLSSTDDTWYPLVWGGNTHINTNSSTGRLFKSYDKLSWQTSSQTLYATKLWSKSLTTGSAFFIPGTVKDATLKIYSGRITDGVDDGHIGLQTSIDSTDGETHIYPTQYGPRCVLALQPRGGSVYIGNMPNGGNGRKLNVHGNIGLLNIGSIKDLAIGGGIFWNPNVESATDSTDAASITLVKSGVAGGTTLVLSQMNDANDTIQFKTNTAARLYHNNYPILTTQNTYVSNNKGYINGTEITQVNNSTNADKLDGHHETYFMRTLGVMGSDWNDNITAGCYKVQNPSKNTPGNYNFGMGLTLATENHADGENRICQIYFSHTHDYAMAVRTHNNQKGFPQDDSGWTSWGLVPTTAGNIASATKLQTARKIWGQSFDGTADVNGLLTHVISSDDKFLNVHDNRTSSGYQAIRYFRNGSDVAAIHWFHDKYGGYDWNSNCLNLDPYRGGYVTLGRWDNPDLTVIREGNVGIGTVNPPYKLTIEGVGGNCVPIQLVNASRDGGWVCNAAFFAPNLTSSHNNVITIGKNYSTRNAFGLTHVHIGDGSASNYAALEVWGIGNVQRWYYDRHSAFLHRTDFASLDSSASYMSSALQIREHGYGGTQADTWANAPRMSWHWSGRVQTQIGLSSNNELYLSKNDFGNAYRLMYETGTWSINISGNANNATNAGNAEKLGGMSKNYGQSPFGTIPCVGGDGVMEIGRYIDYHYDNSGTYDFSTRLQTTGNYANVVNLPSASGTLALTSQVLTWKSQIIDMRNYSESYWHPVTVPLPYTGYNKIKVSVQLNSGDKPSWATHSDGITCNMEIWATASGQGTTDSDTICLNYTYKFCSQNPCGWMQLDKPSLGVVFLRGGSRYTVYTDFDATFTPHNQKYTWSDGSFSQDTGGPYTSCPGLNFNMGAIRADLVATLVQASRVCAGHNPGIDNSISCSNWFRSSGATGWYNTTYEGGWYMSDTSWIRAHNDVGIYTGGQIYSSSSVRAGNIRLERTNEINSSDNLLINYGSSTNVSLCQGGGNVGIGTLTPTQKLDVRGNIITNGFGIQPYYLSKSVLLPTISPGDGYTYKCLEISATTEISCIMADGAGLMNERGILIKFNQGFDGQVILLKDLSHFGTGNNFFWVQPYGCRIIKADSSNILIGQNQISNTYDDGRSRFFVYASRYYAWIEFLCSNIS